jgi:hypothetical protein
MSAERAPWAMRFFLDLAVGAIGTSIARLITFGGSFRALKDDSLAKGCDDHEENS